MHFETVEEPFHNDAGCTASGDGPVKIEYNPRFGKSRRKLIARFGSVQRPAAVGNQLPSLVVNRYDEPSAQQTGTSIEANAGSGRRRRGNPSAAQIRVPLIHAAEPKS